MKIQNTILLCIVLLAISINVSLASKRDPGLDEWAMDYNPLKDIKKNIEYLESARKPISPNSVSFPAFDIIAKINQTSKKEELNNATVTKLVEALTKAINSQKCFWTYNSSDLSLSGMNRFSLFGGIECPSFDDYSKLVADPVFHSNVIFSRLSGRVNSSSLFTRKPPRFMDPVFEGPFNPHPWNPIRGPCDDYSSTRYRNWWADAMDNGVMDCRLVEDSCAYNQGYGGKLFLFDTGVDASHPEFAGMEGNRLTYRSHLTNAELAGQHPHYDDISHGTWLASLTIGHTLGSAKDATLTSIKQVIWNEERETYESSITAVTAALNQILSEVKASKQRTPTLIYSGAPLTWRENDKCYVRFISHPMETLVLQDYIRVKQAKRATEVEPGELELAPPGQGGRFVYDCSLPLVNAIKDLMAHGVPYLVATGNGFPSNDPTVAAGVDMCFYAQWIATVTDCVEYQYYPLYMLDGYIDNGVTSGRTNRALLIGGYQEDFANARWSSWLPEYGYGDYGGANYGSKWYEARHGRRCVDYAAPAARFQTVAINKEMLYGGWGTDEYPGVVIGDDYSPAHLPFSGTSLAVPLAAASILSTMIHHWQAMRPIISPDYGFGDRLLDYVDNYNVINNEIKVTDDVEITNLYNYYEDYLTNPDENEEGTCSYWYGNYYSHANYPAKHLVTRPHNRNLFMPKNPSSKRSCLNFPPIGTGFNPNPGTASGFTGYTLEPADPSLGSGKKL